MIKTNGYKYKLVEYEEQTGDYMVLESLNQAFAIKGCI